MDIKKYKSEVDTLKKFFELYCKDKHKNQNIFIKNFDYNNKKFDIELNLCDECKELINYSFDRLSQCPHDPKPRCRTCPNPCYEKNEWKKVARLMRYSGIQLGLLKIKKFFKV